MRLLPKRWDLVLFSPKAKKNSKWKNENLKCNGTRATLQIEIFRDYQPLYSAGLLWNSVVQRWSDFVTFLLEYQKSQWALHDFTNLSPHFCCKQTHFSWLSVMQVTCSHGVLKKSLLQQWEFLTKFWLERNFLQLEDFNALSSRWPCYLHKHFKRPFRRCFESFFFTALINWKPGLISSEKALISAGVFHKIWINLISSENRQSSETALFSAEYPRYFNPDMSDQMP